MLWVLRCAQFVGANMSLWRVDQAADYLGIRPKTLYEWVRTGRSAESHGRPTAPEFEAAALAAVQQLRRLEADLGEHLSFPQRRELRELAERLERATVRA